MADRDMPEDVRRCLGEDAVYCRGDDPAFGSGRHEPGWHHREYHGPRAGDDDGR